MPGFKQVWCSLAPPKQRFIFWLAVQNKLLIRDILASRILGLDLACAIWGLAQENHQHLFFDCRFSKMLSNRINNWIFPLGLDMNFDNWLLWFPGLNLTNFCNCVKMVVLQALVYMIWINRNGCIFACSCLSVDSCIAQIQYVVRTRLCIYKKKLRSSLDRYLFEKLFALPNCYWPSMFRL